MEVGIYENQEFIGHAADHAAGAAFRRLGSRAVGDGDEGCGQTLATGGVSGYKRPQTEDNPGQGGEEAGVVTFQPRGVGLKRTGMRTGYR